MSDVQVFTHQDSEIDLSHFGIQVPLLAQRSRQIIEALLTDDRSYWQPRINVSAQLTLATPEQLKRFHSSEYIEALLDPAQANDLVAKAYELYDTQGQARRYLPQKAQAPLSDLVAKHLGEAALSLAAAQSLWDLPDPHQSCIYVLGGGMHHAGYSQGRGFCLISDIALIVGTLRQQRRAQRFWIIDVDAHKGDGSAELFAGDSDCQTLSIHMASAWPLDQPRLDAEGRLNPSWTPSDIDIGIEAGQEDLYLPALKAGLEQLAGSGTADFAIVVAGTDASHRDQLPGTEDLALSDQQMLDRDLMVFDFLRRHRLPQLWLMAGGYGDQVYVHSVATLRAMAALIEASAQSARPPA